MKKYMLIITIGFIILTSCDLGFSGTLGGGDIYRFKCDKEKLNFYLDSIEEYTLSLKTPEKWEKFDDWDARGYNFLKGKIFYIKGKNTNDDEIYYVSIIPPIEKLKKYPGVAVRSVFRTKEYLLGWRHFDDFSRSERRNIEAKFKEKVLSRLPLKVESIDEK